MGSTEFLWSQTHRRNILTDFAKDILAYFGPGGLGFIVPVGIWSQDTLVRSCQIFCYAQRKFVFIWYKQTSYLYWLARSGLSKMMRERVNDSQR